MPDEKKSYPVATARDAIGSSVYRQEYVRQLGQLLLLGAGIDEIAEFFEVVPDTIRKWRVAYPAFDEAMKKGRMQADACVAEAVYRKATGYEHEAVRIFYDAKTGSEVIVPYTERFAPDTQAAMFWLKNRQPDLWKEKVTNEHTGKNGEPLGVQFYLPTNERDG